MLYRTMLATALILPSALVAQDLPKGETVMERFIQVTGGKAAYATKKSAVIKGTVEMPAMGLKGTLTITRVEPNLNLTELDFQGIGKILDGFDGKVAWSFNAMQGPQVKSGEEKDNSEQDARFHIENWKDLYKQLETLGTESIEGEPCYKVLATPHKGQPSTQFYSLKTGFLLKALIKIKTAMGEISAEVTTKDYKSVDGILMAHTLINSTAGQTMAFTFQSVVWNVPVPKTQFDPPAEVKALLNAAKPVPAKS